MSALLCHINCRNYYLLLLKAMGKLPVASEILIIFVMTGTLQKHQSEAVLIGSSLHCLLERKFRISYTSASEVGDRIGSL